MKRLNNNLYQMDIEKLAEEEQLREKLHKKSILITGATGMIGTALIDFLMHLNKAASAEIHILAMGRSTTKTKERLGEYWGNPHFTFVEHDINRPIQSQTLNEYFPMNINYIIHAASTTHPRAYATEPISTITTNIIGLHNLMKYAKMTKPDRVVFLSSVEIYGENRGDVDKFDEAYNGYIDCNTTRAGYPESKRVSEALCQAYASQEGIDVVIPRLSRVYGPTMLESDSKAIAQFIKKAVSDQDIVLKSDGSQLYSYCYVMDAVSGILAVMLNGESGQAYNVSDSGSEVTLKELANMLAEAAGTSVLFEIPDTVESAGYSKATKAVLDAGKLEKLGWKPQTHIREGLDKTVTILKNLAKMTLSTESFPQKQ